MVVLRSTGRLVGWRDMIDMECREAVVWLLCCRHLKPAVNVLRGD